MAIPGSFIRESGSEGLLLISMPARASRLLAIRQTLDLFVAGCEVSASVRATVAAALTEAFLSIADSLPGAPEGTIDLVADVEDGYLDVVLSHSGDGIERLRPPLGEPGGYGLRLLQRLTDQLELDERPDGQVELWMRFAVA
jgi:anti-sigma regulatory factor (Ser/Thr protein kinase)